MLASKMMMMMLVGLLGLVHLGASADLPVIHVTSMLLPDRAPLYVHYKAGQSPSTAPVLLRSGPGQGYMIEIETADVIYEVFFAYGKDRYSRFEGYLRSRDGDRSDVYWKASDWGVSISYDDQHYVATYPWDDVDQSD